MRGACLVSKLLDFIPLYLDWGGFPLLFLVFLKIDIISLRKESLNASRAARGQGSPQDAQRVSTEEVVVADVLIASDIRHLQN